MSALASLKGWSAVEAAVAKARADIAAVAPSPSVATEGEAYVMRLLATFLNEAFLGHLLTEDGLTTALPTRGGPNPDYRMALGRIDPSRRYRIEGRLNASERIGIGLYSFGAAGTTALSSFAAIDANGLDPSGAFSLEIGPNVSEEGGLLLHADAGLLITRTLHRDPTGQPARIALIGAPPIGDLVVAQGHPEAALTYVAHALNGAIQTFLEWTAVTSAAANRFHIEMPQMSQGVQGDPDTLYFLGSYNLADGEWLEVIVPAGIPGYWSLHAYNHWCESLPGAGVGNDRCTIDADGRIRIAISPSPIDDMPNWINTLGRNRGALICRIIGAPNVAVPTVTLHSSVR